MLNNNLTITSKDLANCIEVSVTLIPHCNNQELLQQLYSFLDEVAEKSMAGDRVIENALARNYFHILQHVDMDNIPKCKELLNQHIAQLIDNMPDSPYMMPSNK